MYDGSPSTDGRTPERRATAAPGTLAVYTAITASYDTLKEPPGAAAAQASFVAFLDRPQPSAVWEKRPAHDAFDDPNRNAKIHKILSHVYLPEVEYSLWVDGSVAILDPGSIRSLIDVHLGNCDLAVFPHRSRNCVYQEASVCLQRRLDEPEVIWRQACRYTQEGYPANAGLVECSVILRRHTERVREFNEAWWQEICGGSRRDQLSFDYVARKVGLRFALLPGTIADNPTFRRGPHSEPKGESAAAATPLSAADESAIPIELPPRYYRSPPLANARRRVVAFGRVRDKPSWGWVGYDVGRELSKSYDVILYDSRSRPPPCDVLFVVKKRPIDLFVERALRNGTKLVYCPIDDYDCIEQIAADASFLAACKMVVTHCESLIPFLRPYCPDVRFVEHHARYALDAMVGYKGKGYLLWIGGCQFVPYLLAWLDQHPLPGELKILSDFANPNARALAREYGEAVGMRVEIEADTASVAGHRVYRWSEERQRQMMNECRAAFDVKATQFFNQRHKPPTKAQQYVASGIPFAVNADSYSAEYFRARGFDVASPLDAERWLSHEYWRETRASGEQLRAATSIEAVAARYSEVIEAL